MADVSKCSICGKTFRGEFGARMKRLRKHRKTAHPEAR